MEASRGENGSRTAAPGGGGPVAGWLTGYAPSRLPADIVAGLALAAFTIPESLAYASIAGLPAQAGLYAYFAAGPAYALFGRSRQLAVGPTSSMSVLLPTGLGAFAAGDPVRYAALAAATAVLVGLVCLAARLVRASRLSAFISDTILLGFKSGAALVIASTQLPKLAGLPAGHGGFVPRIADLWRQLPQTHMPSLALGAAALAALLASQWLLPRRPTTLPVVAALAAAAHWLDLKGIGVHHLAPVTAGLPIPALPSIRLQDWADILPIAAACFLVGYVETNSVTRSIAGGEDADPDREVLALGVANAAAGVCQAFPVAGGLSQTAVNVMGGATSPLSLVVNSAAILLVLVFFTNLIAFMPEPVLAALVLVAASHLLHWRDIARLRSIAFEEWAIAVLAFVAVLLAGVLDGVLIAAFASLAYTIGRLTRPDVAVLGYERQTGTFVNRENRPGAREVQGALVLRPGSPWMYFNAGSLRAAVLATARKAPASLVIIDLSPQISADRTAALSILSTLSTLRGEGHAVVAAHVRDEVSERLAAFGNGEADAAPEPHVSIHEALVRSGIALPSAAPGA